jgi:protein XagA
MRRAVAALILLLSPGAAHAAAWTQAKGTWQVISGVVYSDAGLSFDNQGRAATPTLFKRILEQNDIEYGLTNRLTLFARTETADVRTQSGTAAAIDAVDNALELGARFRLLRGPHLLSDYDVISVEGMVRSAGAFNFAYSANAAAAGRAAGVRLLYGSPFKLWNRDGFVNLEAGERWLSRPRPNETVADLTAGLWLTRRWLVMAQNFNVVSGPAKAPYVYFRSHKLEASLAYKFSKHFTLQGGAFFSPAGQNALDERGLCLSLWTDF